MPTFDIAIVGGGIFGVTAAVELAERKAGKIVIIEQGGTEPHEDAASTDISKVIRCDYGSDEFYTEMMEICFPIWRQWNREWKEELYHETGFLVMTEDWKEGCYEKCSFDTINRRGQVKLQYLTADEISKRFPAWKGLQGYYNPIAGWAESGKVVSKLYEKAVRLGVEVVKAKVKCILTDIDPFSPSKKMVKGVETLDGQIFYAPKVIVAAGANTPYLLPQLRPYMWASAQTVFHFENKPARSQFDPKHFPVYAVDTSRTGFYGFPPHPVDNRLKIGRHAVGYKVSEVTTEALEKLWREVGAKEEKRFREFINKYWPHFSDAKIIFHRLCCYCDTFDGNFWIDYDPNTSGLMVAAGGSGHGFKFAPILGSIIADVLQRRPNKFAHRFKWRKPIGGVTVKEEMRCMDDNVAPRAAL